MTRFTSTLGLLFLTFSGAALAQLTDPVGFCPPPASVAACTTGNGYGGETISTGMTTFGMEKNGSGTSVSPWYLLIAVPNNVGGAPIVSSPSFTQTGKTQDAGKFKTSAKGSIYDFANAKLGLSMIGDRSM